MSAWEDADEAEQQRRARALASPLRLRILRLCLHESRTNQELAEELAVNPGTLLHHVRSLVATGFLAAEEARPGPRGAKEIPYRATRRSWNSGGEDLAPTLVQTFLQEIEGLAPDELLITRLGVKLNAEHRAELSARFMALFEEYKDRPADPDGEPISLMLAEHPEHTGSKREAS